jgi:hypothetical protein
MLQGLLLLGFLAQQTANFIMVCEHNLKCQAENRREVISGAKIRYEKAEILPHSLVRYIEDFCQCEFIFLSESMTH